MTKTNLNQTSIILPVSPNFIERRIYSIRNQQVMLDSDLAELYQVPTFRLIEAVKRNANRFPIDFMFQLNKQELKIWRSQIAISNPGARMGLRRPPYAFTEYGVVMLSSVLNSYRAIQMNISIVRAFIKLREMLEDYKGLAKQVAKIKGTQDLHTKVLVKVVKNLKIISTPTKTNAIGFHWKPKSKL
jgi:hypothetical protein